MAYFNHAFRKCFLVDSVTTAAGATTTLGPGDLGVVDGSTWQIVANPAAVSAGAQTFLVVGSQHTVDTIGNNPGHGGYSESVKSKGIMGKYISKLWKSLDCAPAAATASVQLASDCVPCGSSIFLRMDVKGSPALRFLNHNAYAIGDSANVCCVDGQDYIDPAAALAEAGSQLLADPILSPFVREDSVGGVPAAVGAGASASGNFFGAPTTYANVAVKSTSGSGVITGATVTVTAQAGVGATAVIDAGTFAQGGYAVGDTVVVDGAGVGGTTSTDDITFTITSLAQGGITIVRGGVTYYYTIAEVKAGTYAASTDPVTDGVSATLTVEGAYVDTQFGNCSFDTRDHYEKEPVQIILSNLDETGEPCNDCGVASRTTGVMAQISGETVLRDLLMSERYMQMPYNQGNADSSRIREIEHSDDIVSAVDRSARYVSLNLLHSVPRFNNPSGVFDNDQYLYTFYAVAGSAGETALDTLFGQIAALASVDAVLDTTDACGSPCTI